MNQTDKFFNMFFHEIPVDDIEPTAMDVAAIVQAMKERGQTQHCMPRARLFREASSGWNPEFQQQGHAAYCADCESAAFVALRIRRPGLWIVAPAERDINVRPVWWTRAVERHLEEAPRRVRLLAAAKDMADALSESIGTGLQWAFASRQATKEGEIPKRGIWRSFLLEDGLLVTELRQGHPDDTSKEYVLSATSRNLKKAAEREELCVRVSIFGKEHRLDKTLRLNRSGSLLHGEVPLTPEELVYLDPAVDKGGLPGIALLEPELLDAEESSRPADNDDE